MTTALKCLLVEDEPGVARFITRKLVKAGHSVVAAPDGETGLELATSEPFSVVILDVGLPGRLDGFAVVEGIRRRRHDLPIVMLTGRNTTEDIVRGFDSGADDYVVKPFEFAQLEARLRAVTRRSDRTTRDVIRFGPLEVDPLRGAVLRDGTPLSLTPTELKLLRVLVEDPDATVTRDRLLAAVWGLDFDPGTRLIDVHIANLRRKLEADGYARLVTTVRGEGFRMRLPADG